MTQAETTSAIDKCLATLGKNRKIHIEARSIRGTKTLSRAESGAVDFLRRNGFTVVLTSPDEKKPHKEHPDQPLVAA
jgi:hypothetical protein